MTTFDYLRNNYMQDPESFSWLALDLYTQGYNLALKILDSEDQQPKELEIRLAIRRCLDQKWAG